MTRLSDEGSTLVEMVVAVALIGTGVVSIVGSLGSMIAASDINRLQAHAATHLTSYAEAVKGDVYAECATTYAGAGFAVPTAYTRSAVSVDYWNGTNFVGTCGSGSGLQRVTLGINSADGRVSTDVQIVKRKP